MSAVDQPLFALLQWVGGEYDGTYTAGVPVDWIIDFNPDTFDFEDDSYLVEWRENKKNKKPKKGWKTYDARVIKISRSIKSLDDEIKIIDGYISPFRPTQTLERIQNNLKNPTKRNLEADFTDNTKRQQDDLEQLGTSGIPKKKKKKRSGYQIESVNEAENGREIGVNGHHPEILPENEPVIEEPAVSNQQIHGDNQIIKNILNDLLKEIRSVKQTQAEMIQRQAINQNPQANPDDPIEIGHEGSNIFVRRDQWDTANSRDTYQSMGISSVRALFDDETLFRSNYKGGMSKINKNAPRRPGLDSNIMTVIKEALKRNFPTEFKQFVFGMAINNMMTEFRKKNKVADNMEEREEV